MNSKPGSKRHVLVVDDDEDDTFFLSKLISDQFPNVTLTSLSKSTLVMPFLKDTVDLPSLIFVDMRMPELSGLELLRQIRQQPRLKLIPVVVWSGYISLADKDLCYESGAASVIIKESSMSAMHLTIHGIFHYWFELVRLP